MVRKKKNKKTVKVVEPMDKVTEMYHWCSDQKISVRCNVKNKAIPDDEFISIIEICDVIFRFLNEEDAAAFKLRWI